MAARATLSVALRHAGLTSWWDDGHPRVREIPAERWKDVASQRRTDVAAVLARLESGGWQPGWDVHVWVDPPSRVNPSNGSSPVTAVPVYIRRGADLAVVFVGAE
jgi:hypothetical protein